MQKKLLDYDCLKVITILLVVIAHITRMYTSEGVVKPINSSLSLNYLTTYIYSFHMPLFVAISGGIYFFVKHECGKYADWKKFIINKIKRLMIPYLVFGIFYVAPVMVLFGFTKDNYVNYVIRGIILSENSRHLWYVFMLFNVFIIVYFLEKYINKLPKWFGILGVIFLYILSFKVTGKLQISNTLRYLVYFYLGYLFQQNKEAIKDKLNFNLITIFISFILNLIAIYLANSLKINFSLINLIKLCSAVFGMVTVYSIANIIAEKIHNNRVYNSIKTNSYGIYLFHPMIIYIIFYYLGRVDINPFVLTLGTFIVTMIVSSILVEIVRKIGLKIIIGEK